MSTANFEDHLETTINFDRTTTNLSERAANLALPNISSNGTCYKFRQSSKTGIITLCYGTRMSHSPDELLEEAQKMRKTLVDIRRRIHANPELSFKEHNTAALITASLEDMGYAPRTGIAGTGVIADIGPGGPGKKLSSAGRSEPSARSAGRSTTGKTIALRADMDALPLAEENDVEYRSKIPGIMHACGHDAHIACLLGAAKLIAQNPPSKGRIRFVFQPAEEATDGDGMSGAPLIYKAGIFEGVD